MKTRLEASAGAGRKAVALAFFALILVSSIQAINITVTGSWTLLITSSNLTGSAGSELTSYYESATNQLSMAIGGAGTGSNTHTWRVDVRRVDTAWHASFGLYIKRTNAGLSGQGSVNAGGTVYGLITTSNQTFWTGRGNRAGIHLQEKLDGVSCAIPAASYSTTVYFTVVQTN
jgi:hypothetical protein